MIHLPEAPPNPIFSKLRQTELRLPIALTHLFCSYLKEPGKLGSSEWRGATPRGNLTKTSGGQLGVNVVSKVQPSQRAKAKGLRDGCELWTGES